MTKQNRQAIGNPLPMRIIRRMFPMLEKTFPHAAHKLGYQLFFTPLKFKTPSRELAILEKAEGYSEKINKKKTQFYTWGNPTDPLVLLVHGWMGRASQFYKIIDKLTERNYFVVAFDGPAHGASSGNKTSVLEFGQAIARVELKFHKIDHAVGHSFGGVTILHAIKNGINIGDITLIATPTISEDIINQFEQRINASPAMGEYFKAKVLKKHGITFQAVSASKMITQVNINSLFLIHDEQDKDVGIYHAELMKERFPAAKTLFTSGLGHTRILRDDEVVNQLISRIDQTR